MCVISVVGVSVGDFGRGGSYASIREREKVCVITRVGEGVRDP